ncbi:MAG: hypothetical protein K8U57_28585 [Planctomycetes bacterium]|nr:hypothetical protein [Planctomycetota bacterium]
MSEDRVPSRSEVYKDAVPVLAAKATAAVVVAASQVVCGTILGPALLAGAILTAFFCSEDSK